MMAWPVTVANEDYWEEPYTGYFERHAETFRRLGFTVRGNPLDYLLPENEMLDSIYHADSVGAARASSVLARDICGIVHCPISSTERPR